MEAPALPGWQREASEDGIPRFEARTCGSERPFGILPFADVKNHTLYTANTQTAQGGQHEVLFVVLLFVPAQLGVVGASRDLPAHYARFFRALGHRVRSYRMERKLTQEDMISYGFSVRHWQMVESGRPITLFTLLRICEAFDIAPEQLVEGLARHLRKRKKG
jgi:DNA-binding Xre family transcriptional regulator